MNARKMLLRLAMVSLVGVASASLVLACSGDDNNGNPNPTNHDSGTGSSSSSGGDGGSGNDTGTDGGGSSGGDSSMEAGNCMSDATTCNSCVTSMQDPYNACSPYTTNCIAFDPKRVPQHPMVP